jgi:hypothetical protein
VYAIVLSGADAQNLEMVRYAFICSATVFVLSRLMKVVFVNEHVLFHFKCFPVVSCINDLIKCLPILWPPDLGRTSVSFISLHSEILVDSKRRLKLTIY